MNLYERSLKTAQEINRVLKSEGGILAKTNSRELSNHRIPFSFNLPVKVIKRRRQYIPESGKFRNLSLTQCELYKYMDMTKEEYDTKEGYFQEDILGGDYVDDDDDLGFDKNGYYKIKNDNRTYLFSQWIDRWIINREYVLCPRIPLNKKRYPDFVNGFGLNSSNMLEDAENKGEMYDVQYNIVLNALAEIKADCYSAKAYRQSFMVLLRNYFQYPSIILALINEGSDSLKSLVQKNIINSFQLAYRQRQAKFAEVNAQIDKFFPIYRASFINIPNIMCINTELYPNMPKKFPINTKYLPYFIDFLTLYLTKEQSTPIIKEKLISLSKNLVLKLITSGRLNEQFNAKMNEATILISISLFSSFLYNITRSIPNDRGSHTAIVTGITNYKNRGLLKIFELLADAIHRKDYLGVVYMISGLISKIPIDKIVFFIQITIIALIALKDNINETLTSQNEFLLALVQENLLTLTSNNNTVIYTVTLDYLQELLNKR